MTYLIQGDIADEWVRASAFFVNLFAKAYQAMEKVNFFGMYGKTDDYVEPLYKDTWYALYTPNHTVYAVNKRTNENRKVICVPGHSGNVYKTNKVEHILAKIQEQNEYYSDYGRLVYDEK